MQDTDLAKRHLFSNKMNVDLDVLGTTMLHWVRSHVDHAHIVAEDHCRRREGVMKLAKKLTNPAALSHGVCNGSVFCLNTRPRDRCLPLRRLGDQVVTEVDAVA
jgi:hypothetical protein